MSHLAAQPVIEKYTAVLGAADVFTEGVAFWLMESIRLDLGYGSEVYPDAARDTSRSRCGGPRPLQTISLTPQHLC